MRTEGNDNKGTTDWTAELELARQLSAEAERSGLALEARFGGSSRLEVSVRLGKVIEVRKSAPTGLTLRLSKGGRVLSGSVAPLDKTKALGLLKRMADTIDLLTEDSAAGLPDPAWLKPPQAAPKLLDESIEVMDADALTKYAMECESAAMSFSKKIANFDKTTCARYVGSQLIFNSCGYSASERSAMVVLSCEPVADDEAGNKVSEGWYAQVRQPGRLDAVDVGRTAARRTLELMGATTCPTGNVPVLFAPETAAGLLGHLFEAASGTAIYKGSSFLAGQEGKLVASEAVEVYEVPHEDWGIQSSAFDGEGVPTVGRKLVEKGVLTYVPCDSYAARRLGRVSTGHSGGGSVRSFNLRIAAGGNTQADLLRKTGTGLLVTSFIGFGFNLATGDFSRGARGFWIKDGAIDHPVQEVTVSGNLLEMFKHVVAVGNDLNPRFGTDSPSLLIEGMTVSGK